MTYLAGVDLGGTNIVCGLLDDQYRLLRTLKKPTEAAKGSDHVLATIAGMVRELEELEGLPKGAVKAVGAGIPGLIDPIKGVCQFAGNLNWHQLPVSEQLSAMLGVPVFIDNDVRMYILGEAARGAGQDYPVVFGLTLGTGVAAALIEKGQLYYGGTHMAGEFGHIILDGETGQCGCGMTGCLETVASATGLAKAARRKAESGEPTLLRELTDDPSQLTAAHLSQAYDQGDAAAIAIMHHAGKQLGKALSYAVTLLNPNVIVIGGGAANAGERLFAPMREELQRLLLPMYWDNVTIKTAELLDDAGVIGSAVNASRRAGLDS
ncbi:glucokinase [Paenibacillus sp. J31TS4]|uniref:ROK family protein n=1 Tax=Paenibacillus sp. J31TS4 TaxID=2807195 RepID=UPI001B1B8BB2|nr:ROK family protein [Paenibacillus sp. J31TS4]GIP37264.1 glucokinase [Paenibacillus sp. J31TS4]